MKKINKPLPSDLNKLKFNQSFNHTTAKFNIENFESGRWAVEIQNV